MRKAQRDKLLRQNGAKVRRIIRAAKKGGWSETSIAHKTGVSGQSVYNWKGNRHNPNEHSTARIQRAFGRLL